MTPAQHELLIRVSEKQDAILHRMDEHLEMDEKIHDDHETRVRDLEKTKWRQQGLAALVAASISATVAWLIRTGGSA